MLNTSPPKRSMRTAVARHGRFFAAGLAAIFVLQTVPAAAQEGAPGPEELGIRAAASAPVLPREALEAAGAYRLYMRSAADLSADFADGASVARSLRMGAAYEPKQLARGAVAFAAVAALQDAAFTEAVRALGADPIQRKILTARLVADPSSAADLDRTGSAGARIVAALSGQGERVRETGRRVKQSAYDVQKLSWSKAEVAGRVERLAEAKALSATPLLVTADDLVGLEKAVLTDSGAEPVGVDGSRPVVARGLALAALAILGEADAASVEPLLQDPACASCLRMAKLNLFQCLAVAKPWYEDVFCLGQHVLIDTGECIQAAATPRASVRPVLARREDAGDATTIAALK